MNVSFQLAEDLLLETLLVVSSAQGLRKALLDAASIDVAAASRDINATLDSSLAQPDPQTAAAESDECR